MDLQVIMPIVSVTIPVILGIVVAWWAFDKRMEHKIDKIEFRISAKIDTIATRLDAVMIGMMGEKSNSTTDIGGSS